MRRLTGNEASVCKLCGLKGRVHWPALALLLIALGGCTGTGGSAPAAPAAEANVPPQSYRQQVVDFMRVYLADPVKVRDAYISEPMLKPVGSSTHALRVLRPIQSTGYGGPVRGQHRTHGAVSRRPAEPIPLGHPGGMPGRCLPAISGSRG